MPVINRAWAIGVQLPGHGRPFSLSVRTLKTILENARRFGIGRDIDMYIRAVPDVIERNPDEAARLFGDLSRAIEESPVPEAEWTTMRQIFGDEELEALLGASRPSVTRYARRVREAPPLIADRLHSLAMEMADQAGAYIYVANLASGVGFTSRAVRSARARRCKRSDGTGRPTAQRRSVCAR